MSDTASGAGAAQAAFVRHEAVETVEPQGEHLPILYDSPHSGTLYPDDFAHAVDPQLLQSGEDRFVDDLIADAPRHGITLMRALFARTYIDPNRHHGDIDPAMLAEAWPQATPAGPYSARGVGLIFRLIGDAVPIYQRRLSLAEVEHRIETYWRRYHETMEARLAALAQRHGEVWHVDWHSMQPVGNELAPDPGAVRPDFVLGDRHGASCDPAFTRFVTSALEGLGYSVAVNAPFSGAYILERHGSPADGRHSLQVEINRGLYMDVKSLEAGPGKPVLRRSIDAFSAKLAAWVRERLA